MNVGELKKKLERLDDDTEIFVSPLIEMNVIGNDITKPLRTMTPTPYERYKITLAVQADSIGDQGIYDLCLLFGYDDSVNYGEKIPGAEIEEFIN